MSQGKGNAKENSNSNSAIVKKVKDNTVLQSRSQRLLKDLELIINGMDEKRGGIFLDWLEVQNKYLLWETTFNPSRLRKYNRAEVVFVNFGFNVGSEFGGFHYGVLMSDSEKSNPVVNIVPLSSLEEGETKENLHKDDIYLGKIPGLNDKESFAIPNQFRPVSKLRVYKPRLATDSVVKLTSDQMDLLDKKLVSMFTKFHRQT
jgi:mRNA interferase MazF